MWQNRAWTLGDVQLHEFDILFRTSDSRYYEIRNHELNWFYYKGNWKLLTQSFELAQLRETDVIRQFPLQ
jgi:hypothetical protein